MTTYGQNGHRDSRCGTAALGLLVSQMMHLPRRKVPYSEDCGFLWAYCGREIDRLLANADQDEMRRQARAALVARRSEWKAADKRVGYTKAKKSRGGNRDIEEALAKDLLSAAPQSAAGVAVKLHSLLEKEDPGSALQKPRGRSLGQSLPILRGFGQVRIRSAPAHANSQSCSVQSIYRLYIIDIVCNIAVTRPSFLDIGRVP
ncbi:hypothetical protein [Neorhizobium sp. T25_13]|uniref:hypothetical protein n=1 Tax=Neorhizobium sp. T25_13 TaxID=2093830 RepID=UPI00155F5369|nr:hypothetical protein [Neorhizobium sp. T25_13]